MAIEEGEEVRREAERVGVEPHPVEVTAPGEQAHRHVGEARDRGA